MAGKIRAAVAAPPGPQPLHHSEDRLMGTEYEANGTIFDEFRRRVERYAAAGADGITVGSQVPEELEKYARAVRDVGLPPVGVAIAFRETPPADELEQLGFAGYDLRHRHALRSIKVQTEVLAAIRRNGDIPSVRDASRTTTTSWTWSAYRPRSGRPASASWSTRSRQQVAAEAALAATGGPCSLLNLTRGISGAGSKRRQSFQDIRDGGGVNRVSWRCPTGLW